ncbi:hypothetical protein FV185_04610 [Ferrovum sp. PN-J185]|jgi:tetrahydromethanopterin S-methyltransferase subunit G|nr:hypothetical protein FV185_04610 [Ferrovum sp. PN-J185]
MDSSILFFAGGIVIGLILFFVLVALGVIDRWLKLKR